MSIPILSIELILQLMYVEYCNDDCHGSQYESSYLFMYYIYIQLFSQPLFFIEPWVLSS